VSDQEEVNYYEAIMNQAGIVHEVILGKVAFGVCGNVKLFNKKMKFLIGKPLLGPAKLYLIIKSLENMKRGLDRGLLYFDVEF
jgi:hypothetical protein